MTKLSVNVNKVATLRNQRPGLNIPDLRRCAQICLDAGAAGITIHPRPDERHIRAADVSVMAELVSCYPGREFNIEGNPFEGRYLEHCRTTRPTQATLVPDSIHQNTSDHGWDLNPANVSRLKPIIAELKSLGCRVSLFMDYNGAIERAPEAGADRIELYTEPYAAAFARGEQQFVEQYRQAGQRAASLGLAVNAGHDLNLQNLRYFLANVPSVAEVSIGHALVADALEFGLASTVMKYLAECR